jgi:hypothetical protein
MWHGVILLQTDVPRRAPELVWTTAPLFPASQLEDVGLDKVGLIPKEKGICMRSRTHITRLDGLG